MKRILLSLAVLAACTGAAAQNSVTPFGIADIAVRYVSNEGVGGMNSVVSGSNYTSRFGLKGNKDLRGNLKVGFWLESGLNLDAGTSASRDVLFDRAAYLYLKEDKLGEIRLGHDRTQVYKIWSASDPFGTVGVASVVTLYPSATSTAPGPIRSAFGTNDRNATSTTRGNNMVGYTLPKLGGIVGGVYYSAGERSTDTTAARGLKSGGATVGYVEGSLSIMGGQATTRSPVDGGATKFTDTVFHAIYDFGVVKASIGAREYKHLTATQDLLQLGLWVPIGSGTFKASIGNSNSKGSVGATSIDTRDVRSLGLGYEHNLDKETALYGSFGLLNNSSGSTNTISGGPSGMAAGGQSRGIEFGIRHFF